MQQVSELTPCRFCGGECAVEVFSASANAEPANATLWMCCNSQMLGGSCPHQTAYLYEHAWQDAMKAKDNGLSQDGVDVASEAARIVAESMEQWGWGPLAEIEGLAEHCLALEACEAGYRAALVRSPVTPISDDVRERVARALFIHSEGVPIGKETVDHWFDDRNADCKNTADDYRSQADAALSSIGRVSVEGDGE